MLTFLSSWLFIPSCAAADKNSSNLIADRLQATTSATTFDDLTDTIVGRERDLLHLNVKFRSNQLQRPWQSRFWFLINLTNTSLTASGAYINGFGRYAYLHRRRIRQAPRDLFEHATWLRVIANEQTVGGATVETAALLSKDIADKRHSQDIGSVHRQAVNQVKELDGLLAQREAAVAGLPEAQRELADSESLVLRDMRNVAAEESAKFIASGTADKAINYLGYALAFTGNAIAGAGGIVAAHATMINHGTATWRTRLVGTAGITDIIASSINMTSPFDQRYLGRFVYRHMFSRLENELGGQSDTSLSQLHQHINAYQKLCSTNDRTDLVAKGGRAQILSREASILDEHEFLSHRDLRPSKERFLSQVIFASSAGSTKFTNGVGSTIGAFSYTKNAHERFEAIGGPAIAYGSGYCVATAELLRNQLWLELEEHKRRKSGTSTRQVLSRQLKALTSP